MNSFLFTDLKSEIVDAERFILKEIGFETYRLAGSLPHKLLYFIIKLFEIENKQLV